MFIFKYYIKFYVDQNPRISISFDAFDLIVRGKVRQCALSSFHGIHLSYYVHFINLSHNQFTHRLKLRPSHRL